MAAAKQWRDGIERLICSQFMFTCPGREHDFSRFKSSSKTVDETQVFVSIGEDSATDLAGDLVTYYTPAEVKWSEYLVVMEIPEDAAQQVLALVQDREDKLWDVIQASNYNDISPRLFFEAATHGTPALWVTTSHLAQPVHCEVVPPEQLYITPGHNGYLDRFRETMVHASTLPALLQDYQVDLTDPTLVEKIKIPAAVCCVVWGFWIDWKDMGNPQWRCEITVDGKRVTPAEPVTLGPIAGSCPLLVGRFNPQTSQPWGRGPGIKALPDLRTLDRVSETVLSALDQAIMNTLIYADDGTLDLSEGLEAGRAYPASPRFDGNGVMELNRGVNVDQGWYTEERIEARIRTAFYQDGPRQRGDTPPTAAQWLDERRRVQQRLGKPSAPLWSEMILPMVQRFEYLAVKIGRLPDAITHDGQVITVMPISPLQKAQNQDKVMTSEANMQAAFAVFGENVINIIDPIATLKNRIKASGDELTVVREEMQQEAPVAPQPPV